MKSPFPPSWAIGCNRAAAQTATPPAAQPKTAVTKVTAKEILADFAGNADAILRQANTILAATADTAAEAQAERMKAMANLGFGAAKTVNTILREHQSAISNHNRAEAIACYAHDYPFNRYLDFITVDNLCKKYSLVCAQASWFEADISEHCITEILNFRIKFKDTFAGRNYHDWLNNTSHNGERESSLIWEKLGNFGKASIIRQYEQWERENKNLDERIAGVDLRIAAPFEMFNAGHFRGGRPAPGIYTAPVDDPIVLQPVQYGYLIVAAWGAEGSDANVVNPNKN